MRSPIIIYGSSFYAQNCIRTGKQHDASVEFKGESDGPSLSVGIAINNDHLPVLVHNNVGQNSH